MARYWCCNFDAEAGIEILRHGLQINSWMMQYQYEHSGFENQGNRRQKARTTVALSLMCDVSIGDYLIAYLKGSRFFGIGQVVAPRKLTTLPGSEQQIDSIERTTTDKAHRYLSGLVKYRDAPSFYDDFTDTWNFSTEGQVGLVPPFWPYAQRIDVEEWQYKVQAGVVVPGISEFVEFPRNRQPVFEIRDIVFVERIENALRERASGRSPKSAKT
jgi:hypothetical protein